MPESERSRPVVVGYDGSPQAADALAFGRALARAAGDPLMLAGAYGPDDVARPEALDARRVAVLERLTEAADSLPQEGLPAVELRAAPGSSAAAALHGLAEAEHPRVVVLGSCHRGPIGRILIGSVAERLLNGAPCPVVVVPRGLADTDGIGLQTVCVGFDGSPEAWTALQRAAQVAEVAGARLRVITAVAPLPSVPTMVVYPSELMEENVQAARVQLDHAVRSVTKAVEAEGVLVEGAAVRRLEEEIAGDADLLVLGSRGYGPLQRVLLGSVSTALMHSAPCPVMVVPRSTEFDPSGAGMVGADEVRNSA
jgi:nucleotide-binding universal stress UspA family protein